MLDPLLRVAWAEDIPLLQDLIEVSVRGLQAHDYTPAQIDGALGTLLGVDSQLIADGTYFVFEIGGRIVACGGWSKRKTLFGADRRPDREDQLLDPSVDAAKIRAFFVHPDFARQRLGTKMLQSCEQAASEAGFQSFELGATLTGVPLYLARGYQVIDRIEASLANGETLPIVRMRKLPFDRAIPGRTGIP